MKRVEFVNPDGRIEETGIVCDNHVKNLRDDFLDKRIFDVPVNVEKHDINSKIENCSYCNEKGGEKQTYEVSIFELHRVDVCVEAEDHEKAIKMVKKGRELGLPKTMQPLEYVKTTDIKSNGTINPEYAYNPLKKSDLEDN